MNRVPAPLIGACWAKNADSFSNTHLEKAMSDLHLESDKHEQGNTQSSTEATLVAPKTANFAVCCNHCDRTIPDAHYHCSTCDNGDFDLCPACVELGITCYDSDHWLLKRFVRGDFILVSTTEKVSPKPKIKKEESDVKPAAIVSPTEDLPKAALPSPICAAPAAFKSFSIAPMRTCNSCVQELPDKEFLHCLSCDDFDLCKACFTGDKHGHHPQHAFAPAVEGTPMPSEILRRLAPGRDQRHHAICDGCDKFIFGIRHKCLDCPDWDYCNDCVLNAGFVHPNHRFAPIHQPLAEAHIRATIRPSHYGICCDGPLCNGSSKAYIVGDRFKCAVCHDTDFCANCEANPANTHNKTHPLIKFKTPVRRVEVKTKGEDENGQKMPVMGDRLRPKPASPPAAQIDTACGSTASSVDPSKSFPLFAGSPETIAATEKAASERAAAGKAAAQLHQQQLLQLAQAQVAARAAARATSQAEQTRLSLSAQRNFMMQQQQLRLQRIQQQRAQVDAEKSRVLQEQAQKQAQQQAAVFELQRRTIEAQRQAIANVAVKPSPIAIFERDTVADGTIMPPNQVFEQTWVLRNGGDSPWPAGCSVKFVGGDYMGHVDSSHPAGIHDLVSASESTVCYDALAPGQEFPFTVLLRTPAREGKVISYWRLQSDDGLKFGHRLWCDVSVQKAKAVSVEPREVCDTEEQTLDKEEVRLDKSADSSQMIFPKVENNSLHGSAIEDAIASIKIGSPGHSLPTPSSLPEFDDVDEYEICGEDETWAEDSDEGLLTDEEYDILDASDEEFVYELQKVQK